MAISIGCAALGLSTPAHAQRASQEIWDLHADLQAAVCQNDWNEALSLINPMLGFPNLSNQYRQEMTQFRQQVMEWRDQDSVFENQPNCDRPVARQSVATSSEAATEAPAEPGLSTTRAESRLSAARETAEPRTTFNMVRSGPSDSVSSPADTIAYSLTSECDELETVVSQIDARARSLSQSGDFASIDSLLSTLTELASLSDQAMLSLQSVSLTDYHLRRYQQHFVSVYTQFSQATRGFVEAAGTGNQVNMETKHDQIQQVTARERQLMEQISRYCGV
ncbi:MAG: hypothetical protein WBA57_18215 [Elainellaceae cyanobacterium]